jgi:hypothetical protein
MASDNRYLYNRWSTKFKGGLYLILAVLAISAAGLNSCCTEMYCHGADDMGDIELLNFSQEEVDTTCLVFYKNGSEFKIVEDSFMLEIGGSSKNYIFYGHSYRKIGTDYDYKLYFTLINKVYRISGFKTSKAECNEQCFPKKDYYSKVDGYEVNGKYKESSWPILQIDQLID